MKTHFISLRTFIAITGGTILSFFSQVTAATYTWTSTTTGTLDWTTAGNWFGSSQYVSDLSNELIFFSDSTTNIAAGTRSITTNVPATLSMNTLTLNGKGFSSGASSSTITIGTSASTWTIGDGTTSTVNLNATQGATAAADFNITVGANLTLNQANTLFTGNGTAGNGNGTPYGPGFTFSGAITEAAAGYSIIKSGSSRLTLNNNTLSLTGGITVNGGTLFLTGNSTLNLTNGITIDGASSILQIGNNTATQLTSGVNPAGTYGGNFILANGGTLQYRSSSNQTLSGIISGAGGLTKMGTGTLTLSDINTYTGKTVIAPTTGPTSGGTLVVSSFNSVNGGTPLRASSSLGAPTTVANGTIDLGAGIASSAALQYSGAAATGETTDRVINLVFNAGGTRTLNASGSGLLRFTSAFTSNGGTQTGAFVLTGTGTGQIDQGLPQLTTGGLDKQGTGTWTLGGSGLFTGLTKITAGTLSLSSATALQNSSFDTTNSVLGGASAGLKIATTTLTLGGLTGSNAFDSRFSTTSGGYSGLTALTLNNASGTTSTYSGAIVDGAAGMTLTKSGAGTQYLTGTMGYTGATAVNAGFLGSNSSFSGPVIVANGAGLAPGAAAGAFGTFTISNATASALTLNGGNLLMDISTASNDLIAVTGTTVLNGINSVLLNPTTGVADGTYTLATYGATTGSGSVVFANGSTTLGNATLSVNAGNIQITVAGGGLNNSVWTGTSGTWDSGTNWNRNGAAAQAFSAGDWVTIDDTGSTTTITSGATVSPGSLTVNNTTKAFTISATIGGSTPVVKLGTNTLTLSGTNTYTGGTFIGGGRVGITANANLGDAAGGITFNGGELYITNDFSSARTVTLNAVAGNQILMQGNGDWTNTGAFTGDGGITMKGVPNGGTSVTMNSLSNDFKGSLTIDAGPGMTVTTRSLADSATANGNILFAASTSAQNFVWSATAGSALTLDNRSIGFTGNGTAIGKISNLHTMNAITINTDTVNTGTGTKTLTLEAVAGPTNIFAGIIGNGSGTVNLTKAGAGVWRLSNANTFSGVTLVSAGNLDLYHSQALQNSVLDASASANGGTTTGLRTNVTSLTFGGISGTKNLSTLFDTNDGNYNTVSSLTLNPGSGVTNTYTGVIANGAAGMTLTKTGAGTQILSGVNTYTGTTTISTGTLALSGAGTIANSALVKVNSTLDVTAVTGNFTIGATQTYGGSGTILATGKTVVANGTLSPGNSPGTLTQDGGNLQLGANANMNWQVHNASGSAGTGYDTVNLVNGATLDLSLLSELNPYEINLWSLSGIGPDVNGDAINFNNTQNYAWTLFSTGTAITGFNADFFDINIAAINGTNGFTNLLGGGSFSVALGDSNTDIILNFTAIPEPKAALLGALGLLLLLRRRR